MQQGQAFQHQPSAPTRIHHQSTAIPTNAGNSRTRNAALTSTLFAASVASIPMDSSGITAEQACNMKPCNPGPTYTFKNGLKLNAFGVFYGVTSILLGIPWFFGLLLCELQQKLLPGLDPTKRVPIFFGNIWGHTLLFFTRCFPVMEGREHLDNVFGRDGK
jgi:hypothetical protein